MTHASHSPGAAASCTSTPQPSSVLCVVNGTPESDEALLAAIQLVGSRSATLTVAACRPPGAAGRGCCFPAVAWSSMLREICAADLERAAELLAARRATGSLAIVEGCGARDLAATANARGCDVIVLAAGRRFARALQRRTSAEVICV